MKILCKSIWGLVLIISLNASAQKNKSYQLASPDGKMIIKINAGQKLQWSISKDSFTVLAPSSISMQLQSGEVLGNNALITSTKNEKISTSIKAINYIKDIIPDVYNQITINCKNDYGIIFRAYNDGVAYRFFTKKKGEIVVLNEEANFNFDKDYKCFVPFVRDFRGKEQYIQSFEAFTLKKIFQDSIKTLLVFYLH